MQTLARTITGAFLIAAAALAITVAHVQGAPAPEQVQSSTAD
jgi:hypothetical protein